MVLKYEDIQPPAGSGDYPPDPCPWRRDDGGGSELSERCCGRSTSSPHEQVSYILSGCFEYEVEGQKYILHKGDSYYVAPDLLHGAVALEEGVILDIFTPQRTDFL